MTFFLVLSLLLNGLLLGLLLLCPDALARLRRPAGPAEPASCAPRPAGLADALEAYSTHYFLWLIAARIALWTTEPEELRHAEEMMESGRQGLARAAETLRGWGAIAPREAAGSIEELLRAGEVDGITPTAAVFNQKAEEVRLLVDRAKAALSA
jgi:hypothetical protein